MTNQTQTKALYLTNNGFDTIVITEDGKIIEAYHLNELDFDACLDLLLWTDKDAALICPSSITELDLENAPNVENWGEVVDDWNEILERLYFHYGDKARSTIGEWEATHEVTFTPDEGDARTDVVYLTGEDVAYTLAEWISHEGASWTCDEINGWLHDGRATPGGQNGTVKVDKLK